MANNAAATNDLVGNAPYSIVPCTLVIEDEPVGEDSRLQFESFPDQIEEAYAVNAYREIAGERMPQPGFVAYRGGNWASFALELKFRASLRPGDTKSLNQLSVNDLESVLLAMERKVRWCQALAFPLERSAKGIIDRVQRSVALLGEAGVTALRNVNLSQLTRSDPPMVLIVLGSFLTIRAYVTNYSLRWEAPFHPVTAQPYGCTVTLTFQRLEKSYPTWESVRNSARATQAPLVNRIQGNIPIRFSAQGRNLTNRQIDNAQAQAQARNSPTALSTVN